MRNTDRYDVQTAKKKSTVLSQRHYKTVCIVAVAIFFILNALLGYNHYYATNKVCSIHRIRASWTRDFNIAVAGGFSTSILFQINRIYMSIFRDESDIGTLSSYYASLCVNIISATSHFAVLLLDWCGTCVDAFGVEFPASVWPEWVVTVPLLAFITVSIDDKPSLSKEDLLSVASLGVSLMVSYFAQTSKNQVFEVILFVIATILVSPVISIAVRARDNLAAIAHKSTQYDGRKGVYERKLLLASRKATLAYCLAILLPIFPLIYCASVTGYLDADWTFVAFMFMSAVTKLSFASLCVDAHLEVSHPSIALIDKERFALTSRRAFLRYMFHEIRVPLNSISLGIQVLSNCHPVNNQVVLRQNDLQTLSMIRDATTFMGETLNDVLALQTVEEGSLQLIYKPFTIKGLFSNLENAFEEIAKESDISFITVIDDTVPEILIGDKFRIRHILANLLSNAFKYSHVNSKVTLIVRAENEIIIDASNMPKYDTGNFQNIHFTVIDEGTGISKEDQEEDIFQPYRQLKQGELHQGRGRGLGLAICKEIVHMHGGEIHYASQVGKGSSFHVTLPLELATSSVLPSSSTSRSRSKRSNSHNDSLTKEVFVSHLQMASYGEGDGSPNIGKRQNKIAESFCVPLLSAAASAAAAAPTALSQSVLPPVTLDTVLVKTEAVPDKITNVFNKDALTSSAEKLSPEHSVQLPVVVKEEKNVHSNVQQQKDIPSLNIMIVDDVLSNRKLLAMLINKKGIKNIHFAEDGKIALELLQTLGLNQVDIIFLDNTMPNMTGLEAVYHMRQMGYAKLVIGITGNSMPDELKTFTEQGADIVITKPLKPNVLDQLLSIALSTQCYSCPGKKLFMVSSQESSVKNTISDGQMFVWK